jgi:hypothetical protein
MATTTPNNGWSVPTSTDFVKDGAVAIETLGDAIDASVGTGLKAWTTYTPTFIGGSWTVGNGTWTAAFAQVGKIVHVRVYFLIGSTTVKTGPLIITLPVTAKEIKGQINAAAYGFAPSNNYQLAVMDRATTNIELMAVNSSGTYAIYNSCSATVPATWATGNYFYFGLSYEAL